MQIIGIYVYIYIYEYESHLHVVNQSFNNAIFCRLLGYRQNECGSTGELLLLSSWLYRLTPYHITLDISRVTVTVGRFHDLQKLTFMSGTWAFLIEEDTCFPPLVARVIRSSLTRGTANKFRAISIKTVALYSHVYPEVDTFSLTFHLSWIKRNCVFWTRISSLKVNTGGGGTS